MKSLTLTLDKDLAAALTRAAKEQGGRSRSSIVREALVARYGKTRKASPRKEARRA